MAQKEKVTTTAPQKSIKEIKDFQQQYDKKMELFAAAKQALQFLDLTKNYTRTYTTFNKERLRTFLRNPKSNEANIRALSRFLYRVSMPYRRLINYNAQQMDLTAMNIIPIINITEENDRESVLKNYYDTCVEVEKDNLNAEIYKCLVTAWIEDACYAYVYEDDTGMYLMVLDGDYCKVSSTNFDGSFNFAFDFTYFRGREELLDYWDKEFTKKYNAYQNDNSLRWQELDPERTFCIKIKADDPTLCEPYYLPLFEATIDNVDTQAIQNVKDNLQIYKLLVARLDTIQGSDTPDDFTINPQTAIDYYNRCAEQIPDEVAMILSPMEIEAIDFNKNATDDVDLISNSMSNLYKVSGGSLVLNDEKSGASIYRAHQIADMLVGLRPLLAQVEVWHNRHLSYVLGDDHARVKYMMVSPWLKNEKKTELIQSAQYGVPVKMAVAALDGYSPLETLSMQFLENDCLGLHESWIPLQSSYTQSGNDGSNEKDDSELTDEGEETKDKEKNKM